jgi:hypothetical protein
MVTGLQISKATEIQRGWTHVPWFRDRIRDWIRDWIFILLEIRDWGFLGEAKGQSST